MPHRIWAWWFMPSDRNEFEQGGWNNSADNRAVEYIRADMVQPTLADALALPEVKALVEAARAMLKDVYDLIAQSGGVYDLHLNGDNAPWNELLDGGQFGDWLRSVGQLDAAIANLQEKE